jgi:hypothetical protein
MFVPTRASRSITEEILFKQVTVSRDLGREGIGAPRRPGAGLCDLLDP